MKVKVFERSGEINKIPEYLNYEVELNLEDPGFKERLFEERKKALKKYLEMKRRIIKKWIKKR